MKRTYLDNNASTPLDPQALQAMLPFLGDLYGNPSSAHRFGEMNRNAIAAAREKVAALLGVEPSRVIFTSGGTEGNNQAIWSAVLARPGKKHIITSRVEHSSVLAPLCFLEKFGYEIERFPVDNNGGIDLDRLGASLREDTVLVSLMAANNETGVIWPIEEVGAMCRAKSVLFHCDGVQFGGKEPINLQKAPIDYFTLSAHKLHGPKGIGALYAARTAPLIPIIMGGGQEHGMRAGTENVAAIVGFGAAAENALAFLPQYRSAMGPLRDFIETAIGEKFPDTLVNGGKQPRLANTTNVSFRYLSAAAIIQDLDERGFAVSAQSACHGGDLNPSHVLKAMEVPEEYIHGTLRISLSRFTGRDQVEEFIALLLAVIEKNRNI